jgi:hypothetical protein
LLIRAPRLEVGGGALREEDLPRGLEVGVVIEASLAAVGAAALLIVA